MAEKPPFAEPDALAEWIGEVIDATSADWKRARRVLRAASNLVRTQTGRDWLNDDGTLDNPLPEQLVDVTVACAARFYLNPNAETQWSRQIDDAMDGGSRKVDEPGMSLTASEKATLAKLMADASPLIAGVGVISTTRGEHASQDMSPYWSEDDGRPGFLHARLTG